MRWQAERLERRLQQIGHVQHLGDAGQLLHLVQVAVLGEPVDVLAEQRPDPTLGDVPQVEVAHEIGELGEPVDVVQLGRVIQLLDNGRLEGGVNHLGKAEVTGQVDGLGQHVDVPGPGGKEAASQPARARHCRQFRHARSGGKRRC